jgi:hypothetical protein
VANCQLEARAGTSVGPSLFNRRTLAEEYGLELARFWRINEAGTGTPIYASGMVTTTGGGMLLFQLPTYMRITPVVSPITIGGFRFMAGTTQDTPSAVTAAQNSQDTAFLNFAYATGGLTAGNSTMFVGSGAGTGVLGFSAEP